MSDPQNTNSNTGDDEENRPLDVSGSFAIAGNPDSFFQGSIQIQPDDVGPSAPTAFTQTAGQMSATQGSSPNAGAAPKIGAPDPARMLSDYAQRVANQGPVQSQNVHFNPEPEVLAPTSQAPVQQQPLPASQPMPAAQAAPEAAQAQQQQQAPHAGQTAPRSSNDFFDPSNRVQAPATTPDTAQNQQPTQVPGYSFNTFLDPQQQQAPAQPSRVPSGFFDANSTNPPGTVGGAQQNSQSAPQNQPSQNQASQNQAPQTAPLMPQNYQTGLTAEQAFFFGGGEVPQAQPAAQQGAAQQTAPQHNAPQSQQSAPQQSAPQQNVPQQSAPSNFYEAQLQQVQQQQAQREAEEKRPEFYVGQYLKNNENQAAPKSADYQELDDGLQAQFSASGALGGDPQADADQFELTRQKLNFNNVPVKKTRVQKPQVEIAASKPQMEIEAPKRKRYADDDGPTPPRKVKKNKPRPRPSTRSRADDDDDDDDRGEDFSKGAEEVDSFGRFERLMTPETKGILVYTFHQAREILFTPEQFFKTMPTRGNIAEPALFLVIWVSLCGLLAGVVNFNLLITIQFFIGNMIQTYLLAMIAQKLCASLGSDEPFETNFRVIAYSQAALIIAALKFSLLGNPFPSFITLGIATFLALKIQVTGLKQVHDGIDAGKVTLFLIIPTVVILIIRFKIFLL